MSCILFHFYIKPQPRSNIGRIVFRCILFHFYIKPQHSHTRLIYLLVVSYSISTSNHNAQATEKVKGMLYLIPFLHQTTTHCLSSHCRCTLYLIPFLHQTTTFISSLFLCLALYLIPFLHQTTTSRWSFLCHG